MLQSLKCSLQGHLNLHQTAARSAGGQDLEQCLRNMALDYRNPNIAPFDPELLVRTYNRLVLNSQDHFRVGTPECAMEFLSCPGMRGGGLLNNITFADGFMTRFMQQGYCPQCQTHRIMVIAVKLQP